MALGPQSSAMKQAVTMLMARRRRNICEILLRQLLETSLDVTGIRATNLDYQRYFMVWLANRALTGVASADLLLFGSAAKSAPPDAPRPRSGGGGIAGGPGGAGLAYLEDDPHRDGRGAVPVAQPRVLRTRMRSLLVRIRCRIHVFVTIRLALTGLVALVSRKNRANRYDEVDRWPSAGRSEIARRAGSTSTTSRLTDTRANGGPGPVTIPAPRHVDDRRVPARPPERSVPPEHRTSHMFRGVATVAG